MKPPLAAFTLLALPRMEQVESSWTGERRSPAPGENMTAPLPTGERGLQALQSGPGLIVHGVPTLADELSHHVPLLPHHFSLLFGFLPLRSLCGEQVSGLLQLQLKLPHFSLASFQLCSHLQKKTCKATLTSNQLIVFQTYPE